VRASTAGEPDRQPGVGFLRETVFSPGPDGRLIALHLPSGTYLSLDRTAAVIVGLLREHGDARLAADALAARFDLSSKRARADVDSVIAAMASQRAERKGRARRPTATGMARVVGAWWRLPARSRRAALHAVVVVTAVEVGLRVIDLARLARWIGAPLTTDPTSPPDVARHDLHVLDAREREADAALAWVLARWSFDPTCLRRSLALGWFLRRRHPRLRLGLVPADTPSAHAWLEADGALFNAVPVVAMFSAEPVLQHPRSA